MSTLTNFLTEIANAIRRKTGETGLIPASQFAEKIASIKTGISTSDATATSIDILNGKTAYVNDVKVTGSMTNQGAKTASLNCSESYIIPQGYHNGTGQVTANSLASQTVGTATAGDIASGKTAWVGGEELTGTGEMDKDVTTVEVVNFCSSSIRASVNNSSKSVAKNGDATFTVNAKLSSIITKEIIIENTYSSDISMIVFDFKEESKKLKIVVQ